MTITNRSTIGLENFLILLSLLAKDFLKRFQRFGWPKIELLAAGTATSARTSYYFA
jgi:hypothetical protein